MRVYIKSKEAPTIRFILPTGLLLNRFTASIALKCISRYIKTEEEKGETEGQDYRITPEQAQMLFAEIRRCKQKYPDMYLVDIESADGEIVKIRL
jgi:hypothetical protein